MADQPRWEELTYQQKFLLTQHVLALNNGTYGIASPAAESIRQLGFMEKCRHELKAKPGLIPALEEASHSPNSFLIAAPSPVIDNIVRNSRVLKLAGPSQTQGQPHGGSEGRG